MELTKKQLRDLANAYDTLRSIGTARCCEEGISPEDRDGSPGDMADEIVEAEMALNCLKELFLVSYNTDYNKEYKLYWA